MATNLKSISEGDPIVSTSTVARPVHPVRAVVLVLSALAFAASMFGDTLSGLFVHRAPGFLAHSDTILDFYHDHQRGGWSTVVCSAVAFVALLTFVWAVSNVIRADHGDGHWPSKIAHWLFWVASIVMFVSFLVCRVVALAIGLSNARNLAGNHHILRVSNILVNSGNAGIRIGFALLILVVGATLFFRAREENLKLLGALAVIPGLVVVLVPLILGFGMAVWVLFVGVWLAVHQHHQAKKETEIEKAATAAAH
jgi:hypothetical protein